MLTRTDSGERIPIQFSDVIHTNAALHSANLNFFPICRAVAIESLWFSAANAAVITQPQVHETREGDTIVLDSGVMRVRIPTTQDVHGDAPGPILQVSRGGEWVGSSNSSISGARVTHIDSKRIADGPLFIAYELTYEIEGGSSYVAKIQCNGGSTSFVFRRIWKG